MSISPTARIMSPTCPLDGVIEVTLVGVDVAQGIKNVVTVVTRNTITRVVMTFSFLEAFIGKFSLKPVFNASCVVWDVNIFGKERFKLSGSSALRLLEERSIKVFFRLRV